MLDLICNMLKKKQRRFENHKQDVSRPFISNQKTQINLKDPTVGKLQIICRSWRLSCQVFLCCGMCHNTGKPGRVEGLVVSGPNLSACVGSAGLISLHSAHYENKTVKSVIICCLWSLTIPSQACTRLKSAWRFISMRSTSTTWFHHVFDNNLTCSCVP